MFPELFKIGGLSLHTYGLFIALGLFAGYFVLKNECKRVELDPEKVVDAMFWGIWAGLIGSRIFYVLYFPDEFKANPVEVLYIWKGGLVFHGAVVFAVPTILFFFRRYKLPVLKTLDSVALVVPLAHAFGRIGCFFAGCCYGKVCDLPWAVIFRHPLSIAPQGIPLHPTQLYESLMDLCIFAILFFTRKKMTREGLRLGIYLMGYGIIRFIVELFRGDPRNVYSTLSSAQWISVVFFVVGLVFALRKGKPAADQATPPTDAAAGN